MSGVRAGRVLKPTLKQARRGKKGPVLRMMAIMTDGKESQEVPKEFLDTGRTGRRNAIPDILNPDAQSASTADLPSRLQMLATTDPNNPQPGPSTSEDQSRSASQDESDKEKSS